MLMQSITVDAKTVTRSWGWFLAVGIAWIVFAFIVLSFNYRTVWAIACSSASGSSSAASWSSPSPP